MPDIHLHLLNMGFRVSYEKGKNIERLLCRASLWPIRSVNAVDNVGWNPCGKCVGCKHSLPKTDKLKFHYKNIEFNIKTHITCRETNFIYVIECTKCHFQPVGSSITSFRQRSRVVGDLTYVSKKKTIK